MELNNKNKVLIAMYKIYNEDIYNLEKVVNADKLGMTFEEFKIALDGLFKDGLIKDVQFARAGNQPPLPFWDKASITEKGIDYVENKIGIDKTLDKKEKAKLIIKKCIKYGWEELKDIGTSYGAKLTAELVKNNMNN